jgi:hypothetical protein
MQLRLALTGACLKPATGSLEQLVEQLAELLLMRA